MLYVPLIDKWRMLQPFSFGRPRLPVEMRRDRRYGDSWLHLFGVISSMMRAGFPSLEVEFDLTPEEKRCIQRTIPVILQQAEAVGPKTFLKMFHAYPLSMVYFEPFRDKMASEVKITDEDLVKHGVVFVKVN